MAKLTIRDLDLNGSRVFIRVDFNVPVQNGMVTDDLRIRRALPTIRHAVAAGAILILASHLGRPKGNPNPDLSLSPVAGCLAAFLEQEVKFVADCVGPEVENAVGRARPGDVIMLENLRFRPEEEANDARFAKKLGRLATYYVNDAFGTAHRAHASTEAITRFTERSAAGLLMEKELRYLGKALERPERPFTAILGGAKISDKIQVVENLLSKVDQLLIGGAMMFTFLRSQGGRVGKSLCEEDKIDLASDLLSRAMKDGAPSRITLPQDAIASPGIDDESAAHEVPADRIPDDEMGLDIGPKSVANFAGIIGASRTIVWNGPMGVFEKEAFSSGTVGIARAVSDSSATSIIGGGDSAAAVAKAGVEDRISHVSTGGGAALEFLAGKSLPGVAALSDKD